MYGFIKETAPNHIDYNSDSSAGIINNQYTVTFEGVLYNEDALWNTLSDDKALPDAKSTETLIATLYSQLGEAFVCHLNGSFILTVYDHSSNTLLGARDRFGTRPLYYAYNKEYISFASEISLILKEADFKSAPNTAAISKYMATGYRTGVETMFAGIYSLPAGHTLRYHNGRLTVSRYWKPDLCADPDKDLTTGANDVNNYLAEAVKSAINSTANQPHCILLEKNIMSAHMAALTDADDGFSVHFDFDKKSETEYTNTLSNTLKLDNTDTLISTSQCISSISDMVHTLEEPAPLEDILSAYYQCNSRQGKHILAGTCGNIISNDTDINKKLTLIERTTTIYNKFAKTADVSIHMPYLNNNFFDMVCKLPVEYKTNKVSKSGKLIGKNVFRHAASKHLPEYFTDRIHAQRIVPYGVWIRNEKYYKIFKETLSKNPAKEYLNQPALLKALDMHKQGKADNSALLMRAYMFVLWYERFFEG